MKWNTVKKTHFATCHRVAVRRFGSRVITVLAAFLLFTFAVLPLSAAGKVPDITVNMLSETLEVTPEDVLYTALSRSECAVDLSGLDLARGDLGQVFARVLDSSPELFYVARRLSYECDSHGRVLSVTPVYTMTGEALAEAKVFYRDTLIALCEGASLAWSEAERALFIHDRLASIYIYDTRELPNYDAYSMFRDGWGVCQAYAMAFLAMARALGLQADTVTSTSMDHAWNHVRVDGTWYHVDVTRDLSPDEDVTMVSHERFLQSDAAMAALGYHSYTCVGGHSCGTDDYEALASIRGATYYLASGWCSVTTEGVLLPFSFETQSVSVIVRSAWDLDGDRALTLGDLVVLRLEKEKAISLTTVPMSHNLLQKLREALLQEVDREQW